MTTESEVLIIIIVSLFPFHLNIQKPWPFMRSDQLNVTYSTYGTVASWDCSIKKPLRVLMPDLWWQCIPGMGCIDCKGHVTKSMAIGPGLVKQAFITRSQSSLELVRCEMFANIYTSAYPWKRSCRQGGEFWTQCSTLWTTSEGSSEKKRFISPVT